MHRKLSHLATAVLSVALAFVAAGPPASSQTAPTQRQGVTQERMTNAEVLRLLKERRSEAEIVRGIKSAIQSGTAAFDLSPNALIALHQAGASNNVLNAMMGDGSVRPGGSSSSNGVYTGTTKPGPNGTSADALNPQPLPPNTRALSPSAAGPSLDPAQAANTIGGATALPAGPAPVTGSVKSATSGTGGTSRSIGGSGAYTETTKTVEKAPGRTGKSADELNPQPLPPNQRALRLSAVKVESPVKNSSAAQVSGNVNWAEIIAVLEKQNTSAQLEASQMTKATLLRPTQQQQATPLNTTSASGTKTVSPTGAAASTATANSGLLTSRPPQKHQPDSPSPNTVSPLAVMPAGAKTGPAIACSHDPTMRILTISGVDGPATFSPNPRYTLYTITGCSLGDAGSNAKVYLYQNAFRLDFQIQEWNDNGIKFALDPNVTGVLDQINATLVVQRADGKQITKTACKFYAARETRMLPYIPRTNFSLNKFTPTDPSAFQSTYTSPSTASSVPNIGGYTAEVSWADPKADYNKDHPNLSVWMPGGEDIYDLTHLQPGFVVEGATLCYRNIECPSGTLHTEGSFSSSVAGREVHVQWQGQTCTTANCGGAFQGDCFVQAASANYALNVMVTGPRGVDPWTGKPAATH